MILVQSENWSGLAARYGYIFTSPVVDVSILIFLQLVNHISGIAIAIMIKKYLIKFFIKKLFVKWVLYQVCIGLQFPEIDREIMTVLVFVLSDSRLLPVYRNSIC